MLYLHTFVPIKIDYSQQESSYFHYTSWKLFSTMEHVIFATAAAGFAYAARRSHVRSSQQRNNLSRELRNSPKNPGRGPIVELPTRPGKHIYHCDFTNERRGALIVELQRRIKHKWTDEKGKDHKFHTTEAVGNYLVHEPSRDITDSRAYSDEQPDSELSIQRKSRPTDPLHAIPVIDAMSDHYNFTEIQLDWGTYTRLQQFGIPSIPLFGSSNSDAKSYREGSRISRLYIYGPIGLDGQQIHIHPEIVSDDLNALLDEAD